MGEAGTQNTAFLNYVSNIKNKIKKIKKIQYSSKWK